MDPIIGNNSPYQSHPMSVSKRDANTAEHIETADKTIQPSSSLTDITSLVKAAAASSPEIRPEALARGAELLNDPSWLSDSNIEVLAERLIDTDQL